MDWVGGFEFAVVGLLLAVTLASGPLVGAVDLTHDRDFSSVGEGTITIGNVTAPEQATLEVGEYTGAHYLEVPDATVEIESITGQPMVVYELSIGAFDYSRSQVYFLSSSNVGSQRLSLDRATLRDLNVTRDRYEGRLRVLVRTNGTERIVYQSSVTVRVRE